MPYKEPAASVRLTNTIPRNVCVLAQYGLALRSRGERRRRSPGIFRRAEFSLAQRSLESTSL